MGSFRGNKNNGFVSQDEYALAYPEANKYIKSDFKTSWVG